MTTLVRGPLFDGRAQTATEQAAKEIERAVATVGADMVRLRLNTVLRTQTPHYRLKIAAREIRPGWKVTDQGVIYGHWLEGTGSRNYPVTRFRGYATFRKITPQLAVRAKRLGNLIIAQYIRLGRLG